MLDTELINHTLLKLTPKEFYDCVCIKYAIEEMIAGDVIKQYFITEDSQGNKLDNVPARYLPLGTVVNRNDEPKVVTENSKVILLGCIDTIHESMLIILNENRTFRISKIIGNNQFVTVLEIEDITI